MSKAIGWAATSATKPLERYEFERRELRSRDVAIDIAYCGVCHSDLHQARNEWGGSRYPLVPGHEIVGKVREIGSGVTRYKPGDTVGVGCIVDSCRNCESCKQGLEQHCYNGATMTYGSSDEKTGEMTQGGYSNQMVVTEDFVLRVPESLDLAEAAPLLCAGITTYSPLRRWNVQPGSKVAIAGLGGLGVMGVKLAKAMGADVTALSRSDSKRDAAQAAGANTHIAMSDTQAVKAANRRFDLILSTIPRTHDVNPYLGMLKPEGTYVLLGALEALEEPVSGAVLITRRVNMGGSLIGGIAETQEMLDFCAENGITCDIEKIDAEGINDAYDKLASGEPSSRFVIDSATVR